MHPFEAQVLSTLRRFAMLPPSSQVVVALSGGPDSVALLRVLLLLAPRLQIQIRAAHANHQLRGEESDRDEAFVRRLCRRCKVPLSTRPLPPPEPERGNLEAALRTIRYQFLKDCAGKGGTLATGHTLDDQAETWLLKAVRGAGLDGLSGIFPVRECPEGEPGATRIVRPLLECSRLQARAYLQSLGQAACVDSSNLGLDLDRNWVRHQLLPQLGRRLNRRAAQNLARAAHRIRQTRSYVQAEARRLLDQASRLEGGDLVLDLDQIRGRPQILIQETLRAALKRSRGSLRGITSRHIQALTDLMQGESGRRVQLPGGLHALRQYRQLRLSQHARTGDFSTTLQIPGEVYVPELCSTIRGRIATRPAPSSIVLAMEVSRLTIRNRRPGDRYRAGGRLRKLKDLFQSARVPCWERSRRLVVEHGGEIVWVQGLEPHPRYRPRRGGKGPLLLLELSPET